MAICRRKGINSDRRSTVGISLRMLAIFDRGMWIFGTLVPSRLRCDGLRKSPPVIFVSVSCLDRITMSDGRNRSTDPAMSGVLFPAHDA